MASRTFLQIKSGPKCPRQLFPAESLCVFILPLWAELTARALNTVVAGLGVQGKGMFVYSQCTNTV